MGALNAEQQSGAVDEMRFYDFGRHAGRQAYNIHLILCLSTNESIHKHKPHLLHFLFQILFGWLIIHVKVKQAVSSCSIIATISNYLDLRHV